MKKRTEGGGPGSKVEERLLCRSLLPQPRPGHAVRGESPNHGKAARAFQCTAAERERGRAGNPARRLDWRPTEKADRGRRARVDASSPILRPSQRGLQGAPQCIAQCGHVVRAGLLRRPLGWPSQCLSGRSTTAPRKTQGGCERKRAFYAVLVVDHFIELENSFTMAIQSAIRAESHILGQK